MENGDLVFEEVHRRKEAVHRLLVNARILATELRGVAEDNQAQIGPALAEVDDLLDLLISKEKELKATLDALGPYVSILGNIIGTGPWFDAYASNLAAIPTGEFVPTDGGGGCHGQLTPAGRRGRRGRGAAPRRHRLLLRRTGRAPRR